MHWLSLINRNFLFMKKFYGFVFLYLISITFSFAQEDISVLKSPFPFNFEDKMKRGMQLWQIPGLSISVVKDGEILYSNAFGLGHVKSDSKVSPHSLFGISSVSKSFTAAAVAILVDEGKLTWDTKIVDILPEFKLKDTFATQNVTLRDALSHKVGISRVLGSRLRYLTTSSTEELIEKLQYFDFDASFRSSFVYSNLMYAVVGKVIEIVSGESYSSFVENRLFKPLEMQAEVSLEGYQKRKDRSYPYQLIEGKMQEISPRDWDQARSAGGIYASSTDLAKWMIMQMGGGVYKGNRLISQTQLFEMHRPQNVRSQILPYTAQNTYGFGWHITDYSGKRVLFHSGRSDGFAVASFMVPELELGVVVMSNAHSNLGEAIAYEVMDLYLGNPQRDWIQLHHTSYLASLKQTQSKRDSIDFQKKSESENTFSKKDLVGVYVSDQYEKLEIKNSSRGLYVELWDDKFMKGDLEFWEGNIFRTVWRERALREEFLEIIMEEGEMKGVEFEFSLRPELIQVGAYPASSVRKVFFKKLP